MPAILRRVLAAAARAALIDDSPKPEEKGPGIALLAAVPALILAIGAVRKVLEVDHRTATDIRALRAEIDALKAES